MNSDGSWTCFTCGSVIDMAKKAHTGHCFPSGFTGATLRYDLRNLRIQDYRCNINFGGNGAVFLQRLRTELGDPVIEELYSLIKHGEETEEFLEAKINEYSRYAQT